MTTEVHHTECPQCKADLSKYIEMGSVPGFCLQCKFPLLLVANKYKLTQVIGQGAVGTVYLAQHVRLRGSADRVVKVIKPELLNNPTTLQRFHREVQVTAELSQRNEHIVRIYDDFGEVPHLGYFYIMEHIPGVSLRKYLYNAPGPQPIPLSIDIFRQLCVAMQVAHSAGVIHRDLKPDNLMLVKKGENPHFLKVLDWGIAKPMNSLNETDLHLTQGAIGTPLYMAPEQLLNEEVNSRTDIYAMGVILYEMLAGTNPFVLTTGKHGQSTDSVMQIMQAQVYKDPPPLDEVVPTQAIPPVLSHVVERCLAKNPLDRFSTTAEILQALDEIGPSGSSSISRHTMDPSSPSRGPLPTSQYDAPPPIPAQSSQHPSSVTRRELLLFTITFFAILGACLGAGIWLFSRNKTTPKETQRLTTKRPAATPTSRRILARKTKVRTPPKTPIKKPQKTLPVERRTTLSQTKVPTSLKPPTPQTPAMKTKPKPKRSQPRSLPRRPPPQRRKFKLRPRAKRSLCPGKTDWILLRFSPPVARGAEIELGRGRSQRLSGSRVCIPPNARRVSILKVGYKLCIFRVSSNRKSMWVRLRLDQGGISSAGYCIR